MDLNVSLVSLLCVVLVLFGFIRTSKSAGVRHCNKFYNFIQFKLKMAAFSHVMSKSSWRHLQRSMRETVVISLLRPIHCGAPPTSPSASGSEKTSTTVTSLTSFSFNLLNTSCVIYCVSFDFDSRERRQIERSIGVGAHQSNDLCRLRRNSFRRSVRSATHSLRHWRNNVRVTSRDAVHSDVWLVI